MNNFNMPSVPIYHDVKVKAPHGVVVIDGAELIHTLCPVSKLTGLPMDLASAIRMALNDPKLNSLAMQVMQTLPAIPSDSRVSDEDKLDFIVNHMDIGTPAETDRVRDALMKVTDVLFNSPVSETVTKQVETPVAEVVAPVE